MSDVEDEMHPVFGLFVEQFTAQVDGLHTADDGGHIVQRAGRVIGNEWAESGHPDVSLNLVTSLVRLNRLRGLTMKPVAVLVKSW